MKYILHSEGHYPEPPDVVVPPASCAGLVLPSPIFVTASATVGIARRSPLPHICVALTPSVVFPWAGNMINALPCLWNAPAIGASSWNGFRFVGAATSLTLAAKYIPPGNNWRLSISWMAGPVFCGGEWFKTTGTTPLGLYLPGNDILGDPNCNPGITMTVS